MFKLKNIFNPIFKVFNWFRGFISWWYKFIKGMIGEYLKYQKSKKMGTIGEVHLKNMKKVLTPQGEEEISGIDAYNKLRTFRKKHSLFVKIILFPFNSLRILKKLIFRFIPICIGLSLVQMFAYEITLDSVQNVDFKIIHTALEGRDLRSEKNLKEGKEIINTLSTKSGYAMLPLAIITEDNCIENSTTNQICGTLSTLEKVNDVFEKNNHQDFFGVPMISLSDGERYSIKYLNNRSATLVAITGEYLMKNDMAKLAYFIVNQIPYYFLNDYGRKKIIQKTWVLNVIILFLGVIQIWIDLRRSRMVSAKLLLQSLKIEAYEKKIKKVIKKLNVISLEKKKMMEDLTKTENEKNEFIKEKEKLEEELEYALNVMSEELNNFQSEVQESKAKTPIKFREQELLESERKLQEIEKLWRPDMGWKNRYKTETNFSPDKRSPFTRNMSFIGFEIYLKRIAQQKIVEYQVREPNFPGNKELIEQLYSEKHINRDNRKLFLEINQKRNKCFHDGDSPSEELVKSLVDLLEKANPPLRAVI